jgi:HAD superfamily hydrolase (TIGR01509 family)
VRPAPHPVAIFLDAGGVLVEPDWVRVAAVAAIHDVAVDAAALLAAEPGVKRALDVRTTVRATDDRRRSGAYFRGVLDAVRAPGGSSAREAAVAAIVAEHARENLWSRVPDRVPAALRRLRDSGRRLVVVSNADGTVARTLERAGLGGYFHAVVDSGVVGVEKPDPAIFHHALRAAGVRPREAVHVGDFHEIDVVGAAAAGIEPVLLDPADLRPDAECRRFRDLDGFMRDLLRLPPPRTSAGAARWPDAPRA